MLGVRAQSRYALVGVAEQQNEDCFILTRDMLSVNGSVWYRQRISLTKPFDISFKAFFGCSDIGADGITFTLQQQSTNAGGIGGGLGVSGIKPSLAVEFDTYENTVAADLPEDHIAIIRDGDIDHNTANTLAGPVVANITGDIEDCRDHHIRVRWDPDNKNLKVYFDCVLKIDFVYDIVANVFGNNPNVFWGFTAATGGRSNEQRVCITYTDIIKYLPDREICWGQAVELDAGLGTNILWIPGYGLSDSTIRNPIATPYNTTTYIVKKQDTCNLHYVDTLTVKVNHITGFLSAFKDTVFCKGQKIEVFSKENYAKYFWNNGDTLPLLVVDTLGIYWLEITDSIGCKGTDTINVKSFVPLPVSGLQKLISYWSEPCIDSLILLIANSGYSYLWNTQQTTQTITAPTEGYYWVNVDNGVCSITDTVLIKKYCPPRLYVPNAFTPDNKNGNNVWSVVCDDCTAIEVRIFDRWGELLFTDNVLDFGWNGEYKQAPCPIGVYVYMITYSGFRNNQTFKNINTGGTITLLR